MVEFKAIQRVKPQDVTAERKLFAWYVSSWSMYLKQLAQRVAAQCTLRLADCHAVLTALETNVIDTLIQGHRVTMGELGLYCLRISLEGKATEEEITNNAVKKAKVLFRPGAGGYVPWSTKSNQRSLCKRSFVSCAA